MATSLQWPLFWWTVHTLTTLRAEATFSLCELLCEKYPLPTTVQIRPEIWTNRLKKVGFFLFLTGLEHCVTLAGIRIVAIFFNPTKLVPFDDRPDEVNVACESVAKSRDEFRACKIET